MRYGRHSGGYPQGPFCAKFVNHFLLSQQPGLPIGLIDCARIGIMLLCIANRAVATKAMIRPLLPLAQHRVVGLGQLRPLAANGFRSFALHAAPFSSW